jgi:hypothetical protein
VAAALPPLEMSLINAAHFQQRAFLVSKSVGREDLRIYIMRLTTIERDFLTRLSLESWTSPPVFDHDILERMVRKKYVTTQATGHGVHYEITDLDRAAVLRQAMPS